MKPLTAADGEKYLRAEEIVVGVRHSMEASSTDSGVLRSWMVTEAESFGITEEQIYYHYLRKYYGSRANDRVYKLLRVLRQPLFQIVQTGLLGSAYGMGPQKLGELAPNHFEKPVFTSDSTFQQVYEAVFKATDDPQHARTEAMKFVRAKRMQMTYEPKMTAPERKATLTETKQMIDEAITARLGHLVGLNDGAVKAEVEKLVKTAVQTEIERVIATGLVRQVVETLATKYFKERAKTPDFDDMMEKIEEGLQKKADAAVAELVKQISFRPKIAEANTPTRKLVQ